VRLGPQGVEGEAAHGVLLPQQQIGQADGDRRGVDDHRHGELGTAERELQEAGKFDFKIESRSKGEDFNALLAIWRKVSARVGKARSG